MTPTTPTTSPTYACPQVNGVFDPMLCASCERLGKKCFGPCAIDMPIKQLIDFCRKRRAFTGITIQELYDETKIAKSTISRLFSETKPNVNDVRHETIRPIYHALTGVDMNAFIRPFDTTPSDELQAENEKLKAENEKLREEMEKAILQRDAIIEKVRAESREHIEDLRRYNKNKVKAILVLAVLLFASLLVIIGSLIIDRSDPNRGFFWLESDVQYFDSHRIEERIDDADADEDVTIAYDGQMVRVVRD